MVEDQLAAVADVRGPDRRADEALARLFDLSDPRASQLLADDLPDRPFALDTAAKAEDRPGPKVPFDPLLLAAVRERLRARDLHGNEPISLLRGWGPAAAPAISELVRLASSYPLGVGNALAAIGGATSAAVEALRHVTRTGMVAQRLHAAKTLRTLTGDGKPLLAAIEHGLRGQRYDLEAAAEAARTLIHAPDRLVPALTTALDAALDTTFPGTTARIQAALALWHYTGDASRAVQILTQALRPNHRPCDPYR